MITRYSILLAIFFEIITLIGRFNFNQTAKNWTWNRPFGIRIHHGYWALPLWIIGNFAKNPKVSIFSYVLGNSLLISDVAHHILLKAITNDFEF